MGEVLKITPGESVEIRSSSPEALERSLAVGEEIDVPRGAVHQMWNPAKEPARVVWRTSPPALAALALVGRARGYSA